MTNVDFVVFDRCYVRFPDETASGGVQAEAGRDEASVERDSGQERRREDKRHGVSH